MSINVPCRDCGRQYHVSEALAGKTFRCKSCGAGVAVPADERSTFDEANAQPEEFDDDIPNPYGPGGTKTRRTTGRKTPPPPPKASSPAIVICAALGLVGIGLLLLVAVAARRGPRMRPFANQNNPPQGVMGAKAVPIIPEGPWNAPQVELRKFPELGPAESIDGSTVKLYSVDFASVPQTPNTPASTMKLRVYLPTGDLADKSIPVVLVAPAGTPLIHGNEIDDGDYHDESLPYAEAGMCAVHYSLDGPLKNDNPTGFQFLLAHKQFEAAQAGILNARNALEFSLARIPAIDPRRIYTAGHSSAATLSLLVAAHEPRVAACIAYAPCTDVVQHCQEVLQEPFVRLSAPKMKGFLARSSPKTHVAEIHCPTFLFYAEDDTVTPLAQNRPFIQELEAKNPQTTFVEVAEGEHYDSMIDEGIPRAIAWLEEKKPKLPAATAGPGPSDAAAPNQAPSGEPRKP